MQILLSPVESILMNNETPGASQQPSQQSALGMEGGPLRPEDIEGLSPDQLDDKIKEALAELNAALGDIDPNKVREAFQDEEPSVTRETLIEDLDGLESRLRSRLEMGNTVESPKDRRSRLDRFVETHFADICPQECRSLAIEECIEFENGCRVLFDEPDLELGEDDAADPDLKERISSQVLSKVEDIDHNDKQIAEMTASRGKLEVQNADAKSEKEEAAAELEKLQRANPNIPRDKAARSRMLDGITRRNKDILRPKAERVEKTRDGEQLREVEKSADLDSIKKLQAEFEALKAEKGTIGPCGPC